MRAIWSGHLTFGLVTIPVALHAATEAAERVSFRQLHRTDLAPIRYKKFCSAEDVEVPSDDIVKGYEVEKGRFAVVESEELEKVQDELGEGERVVDVLEFVELGALSPLLFEKPYFLAPQKGGARAYAVLRAALLETRRAAVAKIFLRTRPQLAALLPGAEAITLVTLRPANEVRDPEGLALPHETPRAPELEMARTLVERMTQPWDPTRHPNEYREALDKLLAAKPTVALAKPGRAAEPAGGKVVDLMEALRRSLGDAAPKGATGTTKKAARRTPARAAGSKRRTG
jgi:DNA end-binding protein Ku